MLIDSQERELCTYMDCRVLSCSCCCCALAVVESELGVGVCLSVSLQLLTGEVLPVLSSDEWLWWIKEINQEN